MSIQGIDVSKWQGNIDWKSVAASEIKFAIIRAGYGNDISQKDPYFEKNYAGAREAGIPVGAYWYSYATTVEGAKQEAKTCLEVIKGKKFEYPIWFDQEYEPGIKALTNSARTKIVKAFCEVLENAGYYTGLYCSRDWLTNYLNYKELSHLDIWVAAYGSSAGNVPLPYGMWQCSSTNIFRVPGFGNSLDCDYAYKDYPTIMKNAGLNGYKKSGTNTGGTGVSTPVLYKLDVDPMTEGDVWKFKQLGKELGLTVTSKKV